MAPVMANDKQQRIFEAGSICIVRDGVRGMRGQDACKQAGISTGLVYYHFTDRDGLLAATLEFLPVEQRELYASEEVAVLRACTSGSNFERLLAVVAECGCVRTVRLNTQSRVSLAA